MKMCAFFLIPLFAIGAASQSSLFSGESASLLEKNKALAQRYHLEIIEKQNLDLADEIVAPDCVFHMPSSKPTDKKGPERAREVALSDLKGYPKGFSFVHDTVLAERNLVSFRWTFTGFRETGEQAVFEGIDIVRIENGMLAEVWSKYHRVEGPSR